MRKITLDIPESKQEAIDYFVKQSVVSDDIDDWLKASKKDKTLNRLRIYNALLMMTQQTAGFNLKASDFDEIAVEVEKQVLDLILGSE